MIEHDFTRSQNGFTRAVLIMTTFLLPVKNMLILPPVHVLIILDADAYQLPVLVNICRLVLISEVFSRKELYREKWKFVHDFDAQYHKHFILDSLKHWILNMYNYYSIVKNNSKLIMPKNNHGYKNKTWSFLFFPAILH